MSDPSTIGAPPPGPKPDRARNVAIALGVATALLGAVLVGATIARRGGGDDVGTATSLPQPGTSAPTPPTTTTATTAPAPTSTTVVPPTLVVAASDQRVIALDSATGRPVRTLVDLGTSKPTDAAPPAIGSVALSADRQTAFFDVLAESGGTMRRVPVGGGSPQDVGAGRAPAPGPDPASLAFLRARSGGGGDDLVLRTGAGERTVPLPEVGCGSPAWSPDATRVAAGVCANGEPTTVVEVDVTTGKATPLAPPSGVRWTAPAYRSDGVLTVAEDRSGDSVVVTIVGGRVTGSVLRRDRTTLVCLDWDRSRSLLFCEADGSVWVDPPDAEPHVVGTDFHTAAW